jgi:hypothetical protein
MLKSNIKLKDLLYYIYKNINNKEYKEVSLFTLLLFIL